jgi:hypothetical protein
VVVVVPAVLDQTEPTLQRVQTVLLEELVFHLQSQELRLLELVVVVVVLTVVLVEQRLLVVDQLETSMPLETQEQ